MKEKMSLKASCVAALAIVILALAAAQIPASGQGKARRIEGTWRTQGTAINCQTGTAIRTFVGMCAFLDSGSMFAAGATNPALTGPGYGAWEHAGGPSFTNTIVFFRFNSDGTYAGTQKVTRHIELDVSGDEFTSNNSVEIADASGAVLTTACSMETGQRLQ